MEFLKKNVSSNNGTLISYTDLPLHNVHIEVGESPNTNADTPAMINMIQQPFPSLDFKGYINQLVIG